MREDFQDMEMKGIEGAAAKNPEFVKLAAEFSQTMKDSIQNGKIPVSDAYDMARTDIRKMLELPDGSGIFFAPSAEAS